MKGLHCLMGVLVVFFASSEAQDTVYGIEGKLEIRQIGPIILFLTDSTSDKIPMTGIKSLKIQVLKKDADSGFVRFAFDSLKAGRYGLRCLLDINENSIMDLGIMGPTEPWGMSWQKSKRILGRPKFGDYAFPVSKNITNLIIKVRKGG